MAKITNREELKAWLEGQSREVAVAIAARSALRVVPLWPAESLLAKKPGHVLALFRACQLASTDGLNSKFAARLRVNAVNSFNGAVSAYKFASAGRAYDSQPASAIAVDAVTDVTRAYASDRRAYTDPYATRDRLAHGYIAASTAGRVAHLAAKAANSYSTNSDFWGAVSTDVTVLAGEGVTLKRMMVRPLWSRLDDDGHVVDAPPASMLAAWDDMRGKLAARAEEGWSVWVDWCEDRLAGRPLNIPLEVAIASLEDDVWNAGAEVANARIAELVEEHRPKPRPQLVPADGPGVCVFGENERGQIDLRERDESKTTAANAEGFLEALRQKMQALIQELNGANCGPKLEERLAGFLKHLDVSAAELDAAAFISLYRSLSSDWSIYSDSDELTDEQRRGLLDVVSSAKDFATARDDIKQALTSTEVLNVVSAGAEDIARLQQATDATLERHSGIVAPAARNALAHDQDKITDLLNEIAMRSNTRAARALRQELAERVADRLLNEENFVLEAARKAENDRAEFQVGNREERILEKLTDFLSEIVPTYEGYKDKNLEAAILLDVLQYARDRVNQPLTKSKSYYVSYAWADDETPEGRKREEAVDDFYDAAKRHGLNVFRDKERQYFGNRITEFMNEIAEGDVVIIFLSEKYLISEFCIYELHQTWVRSGQDADNFLSRVRIFTIPPLDIHDARVRNACADHWAGEAIKHHNTFKNRSVASVSTYDHRWAQQFTAFPNTVPEIFGLIADMVRPQSIDELKDWVFD